MKTENQNGAEKVVDIDFNEERELFNRDKKWYLDELSDEEFFDHRKGRRELYAHLVGLNLTPEKAILAMLDCKLGYSGRNKSCRKKTCPLYPFNPYRRK